MLRSSGQYIAGAWESNRAMCGGESISPLCCNVYSSPARASTIPDRLEGPVYHEGRSSLHLRGCHVVRPESSMFKLTARM